ncbi:DNA polymerase III subunit beta [Brucella anthropi]|uniref:DNA polymerase III subunit beta n=1 Tax=Brucella anthropi TaxID=529 RepID=UPI00124C8F95|nr:DNA polymerase III subunit beta [Brucella anthropi]KAB2781238.1 hypothetical protein F9K99_08515 [Brucella anthropi]
MTTPIANTDATCGNDADGFFLKITVASLRKALNTVACPSSYLPILNMVMFDRETITGTNCDIRITADMETIEARGKALVPRSELSSLTDNLHPATVVVFKSHSKGIEAIADRSSYVLPACDIADFPDFQFEAAHTYNNPPKQFTKAIRYALGAVSDDDTRYYLQGVCIHKDIDGNSVAVGSNGHILAAHPLGIDAPEIFGSIIPTDAAKRLANLPAPKRIEASNDGRMAFHYSGITIHARLIDATYPDWTRLPCRITEAHRAVALERKPLLKLLCRMNAVLTGWDDNVHISLISSGDTLLFTGKNRENFEANELLEICRGSGTLPVSPRYNACYLIHITHLTQGQTITLNIANDYEAAIIHGEGDGFHLLMPVNPKADKAGNRQQQESEKEGEQ